MCSLAVNTNVSVLFSRFTSQYSLAAGSNEWFQFLRSYLIHRWWAIKRCFLQLVSSYLVSPVSWERNYQLEQHSRQISQTQSKYLTRHWSIQMCWLGPYHPVLSDPDRVLFLTPRSCEKWHARWELKHNCVWLAYEISLLEPGDYLLLGIIFSNWADIVTMLGSWMLH